MQKWLLGFVMTAVLMTPAMVSAQSAVGVRAGMRWSDLDTSQDAATISGLVIGGYYGFGLSDRLAVQFEAVYGTRGAEALRLGAGQLDPEADPVTVEMSYMEVPVLLRAGFPGDRFLPSVFAGPYVGFLLDCQIEPAGGDGRACDDSAEQGFNSRSTEYGMVIGAALDLLMGESTIYLDARYTLGLRSIQAGEQGLDARHTGLAISGGVAVPLGR